ncbi:hypothetical protein, partial [Burkholderia anthina]|uniref:hypothetical protein n=1 Tax=Burkholderia anthina TaxID=179879 RepID=UPI001C898938
NRFFIAVPLWNGLYTVTVLNAGSRSRQAQLDDAISLGLETSEQGFSRSRFRAIRNARDMAIHARDVRLTRFDNLMRVLNKPLYSEYKLATLQIV